MRIRTDDEVYRVDGVWLGPPNATFPFRARYVAWGVGLMLFVLVLGIERQLDIGFGFFSTAWAVVITIALTRIICSRISHERPLGAVASMWLRELTAPRETSAGRGGAASAARVRVTPQRPRPGQTGSRRSRRRATALRRARTRPGARRGPRRGNTSARRGEQDGGAEQTQSGQDPTVRTENRTGGRDRRTGAPSSRRGRSGLRSKEVRGVRTSARS